MAAAASFFYAAAVAAAAVRHLLSAVRLSTGCSVAQWLKQRYVSLHQVVQVDVLLRLPALLKAHVPWLVAQAAAVVPARRARGSNKPLSEA